MRTDIRYSCGTKNMPRVFRVMKKDTNDNLPVVAQNSLGARRQTDVDVDAQNNVQVNGKGMSVSPNWRSINHKRIPKRKRDVVPGAQGSNNTFCFRHGTGPFVQGAVTNDLTLEPDSATHGNVAPAQVVQFPAYEGHLAATRPDWVEDET